MHFKQGMFPFLRLSQYGTMLCRLISGSGKCYMLFTLPHSLSISLLLPAFSDCYRSIVLGQRSAVCASRPISLLAIGEVCPIDQFCTKRKR